MTKNAPKKTASKKPIKKKSSQRRSGKVATKISYTDYDNLLGDITGILEQARKTTVRTVNSILTSTYWLIGWRIIEFEQEGKERAEYGEKLLLRLSRDLTRGYGKGLSRQNLQYMRIFYLSYPPDKICQTLSDVSVEKAICQTLSGKSVKKGILKTGSLEFLLDNMVKCFPLPWSAYVRLLTVKTENAREFYETEALRGGWSVRQLDRQINSQFYERAALSKNKVAMLEKGQEPLPGERMTPEQEIKNPYILEFLGLRDEYSESELEDALIKHLETFLLELGGEFCFIGRQKRLRIGDEWYRIDLLFYHRRLRCLVLIDLKIGRFTHADAGQMHLYCNYAREHWTHPDENPPVGIILCTRKNAAVAHYALGGLPNKIMAAEYRTALPDEELLAGELKKTRQLLEKRKK